MPERVLHVALFGMRRQSEGATALLLIRSRVLTTKRRRASLAATLIQRQGEPGFHRTPGDR
jgi:hypothetical protein